MAGQKKRVRRTSDASQRSSTRGLVKKQISDVSKMMEKAMKTRPTTRKPRKKK